MIAGSNDLKYRSRHPTIPLFAFASTIAIRLIEETEAHVLVGFFLLCIVISSHPQRVSI